MKEIKKCKNCGKTFVSYRPQHTFCNPECKKEATSKKRIEQRRQERERRMLEQQTKGEQTVKKRKNSADIEDIANAASGAGMTYGQYVAKMGL